MSRVLANPGTPTKSPWPRAKSATSSKSMTDSCPTIFFLISATRRCFEAARRRIRSTSEPSLSAAPGAMFSALTSIGFRL